MTAHIIVRRGSLDAGFSLMEALVALCLLALVASALPSLVDVVRRALTTAERLDRASVATADFALVTRKLSEAIPVRVHGNDGLQSVAFAGSPRTLSFVATMLSDDAASGLYRFTLAPVRAPAGTEHVQFTWQPYRPSGAQDAAAGSRVIVRDANGFQLRYFGRVSNKPAQWHANWTGRALPAAVELTAIATDGALATRRVELLLRE